MKTLSEIKRNIIAFYSRIQNRVTDFNIGSVAHDLIFSVSASLEDIHRELSEIEKQAYIATATGDYLDKLIEGTFQISRTPATRSIGYVVVFGDSPVPNPDTVTLRYADFNYATGEFTGGLQGASKFIGRNNQGDEGIVYALINPRNLSVIDPATRLIDLGGRYVQYLILPVASVLTGTESRVIEGGITSFPSPPTGLSSVLNTTNPGLVFFSSGQQVSSAPFYSRFTETINYLDGKFRVVNAYNFSPRGFVELRRDINEEPVVAIYSDAPIGTPGALSVEAGLIFEYIEQDTTVITLKDTILGSPLPFIQVNDGGEIKTLTLRSFEYDGTTYDELTSPDLIQDLHDFLTNTPGLVISQRPDQISSDLIFDPDNILTEDYRIADANMVGGGTDEASDEEYREMLRKYLNSLAKATPSALEAGALQVPGISFAKVLPPHMIPRGSTTLLVSNEDGIVSSAKRHEVREYLDQEWKAAGINLIVTSPQLIRIHLSAIIHLTPGASQEAVYSDVRAATEDYLREKNPGDSLKYSEILTLISEVPGVDNVFNLIILRDLTLDTYITYKADYDLAAMREVATGYVPVSQASPITPGSAVRSNGVDLEDTVPTDPDAIGIVHHYDSLEDAYYILEGNPVILYDMYDKLITGDITVPEDYKGVLMTYRDSLANDMYAFSYLFSEPLTELPAGNYPVKPETIEYKFIKDYTATETQIFRMGVSPISATESAPLVGINFI